MCLTKAAPAFFILFFSYLALDYAYPPMDLTAIEQKNMYVIIPFIAVVSIRFQSKLSISTFQLFFCIS